MAAGSAQELLAARMGRREDAPGRNLAMTPGKVVPRPTDPHAPGARRPANSALSSARFAKAFGIEAPDWRTAQR